MEEEPYIGEGKEFHTLGADEPKAREPVNVRTLGIFWYGLTSVSAITAM
jgi:hypothetical protein